MSETYHTVSKASFLIDRLEALRELVDDVKFSSIDMGCEIHSKLDELEKIFYDELGIKERALLEALEDLPNP